MNPVVRPSWSSRIDPSFLVLLATATALFAAGMSTLSLESLDDAFYARKGVEMARSGGFFTVTWAGQPTFQNPPLQIWFIGQSHSLFGEGDLAARFPSLLMALATLVITNRIGRRLVGRQCALTAVALLLVTPLFGLFVDLSTRVCAEDPAAYAGPALGGACSAAGSSARSHVHRTIRCHLLLMCKQQGRTGGIAAELYVDSGVGGVPGRDDRE